MIGQMRSLGNQIAAQLGWERALAGEMAIENLKNNISSLRIYFQIAKAQNWVRAINWTMLEFEYFKLERESVFEATRGERKEKSPAAPSSVIMSHNIRKEKAAPRIKPALNPPPALGDRQERILESFSENASFKMSDLVPLFKGRLSERTLRNELNLMVRKGFIKKRGLNRYTEYYKA